MTSLRAVSLSSWKAIWQMTRWPRSPQAPTGDADPMKAKETARQASWRNDLEYSKADPPHRSRVVSRVGTLVPATPGGQSDNALTPGVRGIGRRLSGLGPLSPLLDSRLWHQLLERLVEGPVSESGTLCPGDGSTRGGRRRRALKLAILFPFRQASRTSRGSASREIRTRARSFSC